MTIVVHRGAGAYICGEETALIESLEGKRGQPRSKPPFPAISGVYASPTVVNNVETMATVPPILELGAAEYAKLGVENSRGTRVVSVSGHVANGGNYEIEPGISLRDLIYAEHLGGGVPGGRKLKAVDPGRLVDGDPARRRDRRRLRLRLAAAAAHRDGLGRRDLPRRARLHGAARHPRQRVLRARVVRQVHAVPRGHALDDGDPAQARGGRRDAAPSSTCCSTCATASTASACARSARPPRWPSRATSRSSATSSSRTSTRRLPVRRHSPLDHVLAPVAMHAHPTRDAA